VQFFFDDLPGLDQGGLGEQKSEDSVLSSLMNPEGVTIAKAFREADNTGKRRMIAAIAKLIAESKE
jgi:hypothetical protein